MFPIWINAYVDGNFCAALSDVLLARSLQEHQLVEVKREYGDEEVRRVKREMERRFQEVLVICFRVLTLF